MNPFIQSSSLHPPQEFPFPMPPYNIQKDFMTNIYTVLEEKKLGIFESPTGTGKSLSIICGVLRWLFDHETRNKSDLNEGLTVIEKELQKFGNNPDEDWLTAQSKQAQVLNLKNEILFQLKSISESEDEINRIKKKFENKLLQRETAKVNKFCSLNQINNEEKNEDEEILLEDLDIGDEDKDSSGEEETENKYEETKIYFCSRTHSQLSQFISEIQKSPYSETRVVPLASRQTFCVNPSVKKLKNITLINERCLELQKQKGSAVTKTGSSKQIIKKKKCVSGCPYNNKDAINNLKEEIIVKVLDVEELVTKGQEISACPYYASRAAIAFSQLVVVPYNTLLHKSTREASKIKLKNNVVIIDEAHNLLDAIGNMHSSHINGIQLCLCYNQLNQYKDKYEKLFSASNILYLTQLTFIIGQLIWMIDGKVGCDPVDNSQKVTGTEVFTLADFVHAAEIDNFNLFKLLEFCRRSKISHKLQGFVEKYPVTVTAKSNAENGLKAFLKTLSVNKNTKRSESNVKKEESNSLTAGKDVSNNPILPIVSFLECLTNHCEDGRIICTRQNTVGQGSLKFLLLNPAVHFEDIVKEARAVVVAGGTMQPISEFQEQLFLNAGANASRIMTFSCGHIIPSENILPIVLCSGPSGQHLDYSYQTRSATVMLNELARILDNICNVVPAGIICFFPSYDYEQIVYQHFEKTGFIEKLSKKKKIFREPKKSGEVEHVLAEFSQQISEFKKYPNRKPNGSLLFSVIGGKLSEGLNFSDDLGRCVIVVGLPYPNIKSAELQEKMNYLNKTAGIGSGNKHYENLCMKAVNQSIGRAIRHQNDYATVLLVDHRYSRENIQAALPNWMKPSLLVCEKFGIAFGNLTKFFKSRIH